MALQKAKWQEIVLICTRILCCIFYPKINRKSVGLERWAMLNHWQLFGYNESKTIETVHVFHDGFRFYVFFWMLRWPYVLVPFVFNQNSIMFRYAWKYFRLFPLFSFWIFEQMANTKVKQTVLMISTRCAPFLLFDVVSFSFFMHSNKSSTFCWIAE